MKRAIVFLFVLLPLLMFSQVERPPNSGGVERASDNDGVVRPSNSSGVLRPASGSDGVERPYDSELIIDATGDNTAEVGMTFVFNSGNVWVNWGDGNTEYFTSATELTHSYSPNHSGDIKVYMDAGTVVNSFTQKNTAAGFDFELSSLPDDIDSITFYDGNMSGNLEDLPGELTFFLCDGSNTVSGDLADLPSGLTYFRCDGLNTISDYSYGGSWAANMIGITSLPAAGSGLSGNDVDSLLMDLSTTTWTGSKILTIDGNNGTRTSASDAAKATLEGMGVTVTVNE